MAVEADLVIFDKDGTLIDFRFYWGERTQRCVERLAASTGGGDSLRQALYHSLGYDPERHTTAGDGPLASATMDKIYHIAAVVLYQQGRGWDEAEALVQQFFAPCMGEAPTLDLVRSLGDVAGLFRSLHEVGVKVAIVTSDDHVTAVETLALLGVDACVSAVVGGDDDPTMKPAPDAILHVCRLLDIPPARAVMVGDTVSDMVMATRAGVGCRVAVLSGVGTAATLCAHSDFLIESIDALQLRSE